MSTPSDPFGAAALRRAVLDAWTASPDRFREDANAEEDVALGAYRDRAVVELAQNAADAAARAGVRGRLVLRLEQDDGGGPARLLALNTGAPLDAAGVRSLAALRASAKRPGGADAPLTGRFGVGAASLLGVSEDVTWASLAAGGSLAGVRFGADPARAAVAGLAAPALDAEVAARGGAVPVLRLPFPLPGGGHLAELLAREGCDTAVVAVLRDDDAARAVAAALDAVDDPLLLGLPALGEVVVEQPGSRRVLRDVDGRWHLLARRGAHEAADLAGLGAEERERAARAGWSLTWALPREPRPLPGVLLAPTPTDEPLALPAVLVADLPLDAGRRRVPDAPAVRRVLREAGAAYAALLEQRALAGEDVLAAVPVGLAAGWVDAAVREAAVAALAGARVLLPVEGGGPLRPDRAQALDDGPLADDPRALGVLAPLVGGLVAAPRRAGAALEVLGVRRVGLPEVAEALPPEPAAWCAAAAALAPAVVDPAAREQLAVLRVPLAGGRTAPSPRGLLLPAADLDPAALAGLAAAGLRLVHPVVAADPAAARLLTALGSVPAAARDLLAAPEVAALVGDLEDDDERVEHLLALVAGAVARGGLADGELPALAELPLPAETGEVLPAAGLVLPGSPAADLLDPEEVAPVGPGLLARWGAPVLAAAGVAGQLVVLALGDVDLLDPPEELLDLAGGPEWVRDALERGGAGATAGSVVAVRDLDLVRRGARGRLLEHLASSPRLRAAVLAPVRVVRPDGSWTEVPPVSGAWLRAELGLAGCAAPGCEPALAAVLPPAPAWAHGADPVLGRALGLVAGPADLDGLDADGWQRVLDAAAPGRDLPPGLAGPLGAAALLPLWRALARAAAADPGLAASLDPPSHVLALDAAGAVVRVPAEGAAVVDDPCWAQRTDLGARLVAGPDLAAALADALDTSLSSERGTGTVVPVGATRLAEVPPEVLAALPGCPRRWTEHEALEVDGVDVAWWVSGRGAGAAVHAATPAGLARGLALAAGRWEARALVVELLTGPARAALALLEDAAGTPGERA
ncbi:sacsin N-terminal ATP-binding-like domain-containing protein [Quadrisphaera sp. KR29]|uniref:sacsin N-terminal ATP-binding-like domain-containing protein n=1 Tax=Quadrisphaera sp. KR29 TaxID=3461391 RepID=UPI0040450957